MSQLPLNLEPDMLERVVSFNQSVVGIAPRPLTPFAPDEKTWMVRVLQEEADELGEATTVVDQVDALVDSIIFAMGGLYRLGLTHEQATRCFNAVMDANFEKKAGQKAGRVIGQVSDAVKPEGWVGPEARIAEILHVQG